MNMIKLYGKSDERKAQHLISTWQDTDVLEAINKALRPFTEFTDVLSSEKCLFC